MPSNIDVVLQVSGVESNAYGGDKVAANANDGSVFFPSSWIANTDASKNTQDDRNAGEDVSLTIDLGGIQVVKTLRIVWNYPSVRQYNYSIWKSADGSTFSQVGGSLQSAYQATAGSWEDVDLGGVEASHVQIRSTGNTDAQTASQGWVAINEVELLGDQLVQPPNGFVVQISGEGIEQNHAIYGAVGDNSVVVTPDPALTAGNYSYTVSGPNVSSDSGSFVIAGGMGEERCITHVQNVVPGASVNLDLADFDDGLGGVPQRFVIAQQPAIGSLVVSDDGQLLSVTLPSDATGKSNAKVNVEYDLDG